ncbi:DUF3027 domain-containing protein [Frankia sp. Cppng1_Ct_nod]|uniref:DUF3027 domain-containing protein n=1 Tax=Frankia sp. Cppng1_Ct_nod TaxID=2897162 RepID=UPI001F5FA2EF|nr:DUF3027 domain-containing protein [Frankia sp. Cppng1_Ct_nod]
MPTLTMLTVLPGEGHHDHAAQFPNLWATICVVEAQDVQLDPATPTTPAIMTTQATQATPATPGVGAPVPDRPAAGPDEPGPVAPASRSSAAPRSPVVSRPARSPRAPKAPTLDAVCATAVDQARAAAVAEAGDPDAVGEHLGVEAESERLVLHRFACTVRAYPGWVWTVVVTRASRMRKVTVDDVVLLPGDLAMTAPPWVPWSERLRPGDVGVGDLLPTAADDPRLTLRLGDVEEFVDTDAWNEFGLGRPRLLSLVGRDDAVARWYAGESGPEASIARVAPAACLTCGFHVRLAGILGRLFGVCANEMAPDDGRVTTLDHGCGAHSEALVAPSAHPESIVYDDDPSDLEPTDLELVGITAHPPGSVPDDSGYASAGESAGPEPYGHS